MPNPLIAQGVLNRLRGSVFWNDFAPLNVTAPYLGKDGIELTFEGESTLFLPQMTGVVTSQQPYLMISLVMNLIKTQALSNLYKQQWESNAQLGNGTVYSDSSTLGTFAVYNCAIEGVRALKFSGEDASYAVTVKGYYNLNASLFDQ